MLSARRSRPEGSRAMEGFLGGGSENLPSGVRGRARKIFEFGAFGDSKITSKQCNVAIKLYEKV